MGSLKGRFHHLCCCCCCPPCVCCVCVCGVGFAGRPLSFHIFILSLPPCVLAPCVCLSRRRRVCCQSIAVAALDQLLTSTQCRITTNAIHLLLLLDLSPQSLTNFSRFPPFSLLFFFSPPHSAPVRPSRFPVEIEATNTTNQTNKNYRTASYNRVSSSSVFFFFRLFVALFRPTPTPPPPRIVKTLPPAAAEKRAPKKQNTQSISLTRFDHPPPIHPASLPFIGPTCWVGKQKKNFQFLQLGNRIARPPDLRVCVSLPL